MTQSAATLSWSASTDNVGVVGYHLYVDGVGVGTTSQTSFAFSGFSCGTSYTLGVDAYDAAGNRSAVSTLIVTTSACADTSPPAAPTNLAESASTTTSITAAWTASTDNVGVTGYRVFLDGTLAGTTATTSYTLSGLACGTSHQVVVDAHDAAGNNSPQASATMATAACPPPPPGDTTPPSTPTGLAVSSGGQTTLALSWNASSDNVGVTGYGVYRNGTLAGSPTATSYTLSGLSCGTSYTVAVDAADAAGNRSTKATITASTAACPDTQAPTVPSGVALATRTTTSISIGWTASTDNVGVAGYHLYLAGTAVGTATTTSYTFTGLTCNTNYTLGVDAYDAAGNKSAQATTAISTSACPDTTPPSTPTGLATSGIGQTSMTLSWTASTDNVGVTGYRLYQNGTQVGTSTVTNYTFSGLACGTSYTLGVAAVDAAGNVSGTATLSATTAACSGSANVYVSTSGNDSTCVRGDQSKPCLSFNKAYTLASCGDTVQIAGGTYGAQTIRYNAAQAGCGSAIRFVVASGATVAISGDLGFNGARHVSVVSPSQLNFTVSGDLNVEPSSASQYPVDVTVSYIDFGQRYEIQSTDTATISHNDFGPALTSPTDNNEPEFWYNTAGAPNNTGITFAFNTVHDFTSSGGAHTSCGLVSYLTNSIIRGNVYARCDNEDLLVKSGGSGGGAPSGSFLQNVTFEDNSFAAGCGSCGVGPDAGLSFNVGVQGGPSAPYSGFVIRGNSFHDPVSFNQGNSTTFTGSFFTANILPRTKDATTGTTCALGLTSAYNVFVGGSACGDEYDVGECLSIYQRD